MTPPKTFYFIPHTHWEGAVFKTREGYLEMGLPNILRALRLLKEHPGYRFVLDQACYVKPFLERYPEAEPDFRQMIAEGRLAIAGGMDVMPDVNMPGGESFVRQLLYGKTYFRKKLGIDVKVGWQLDTFGHHAQMPQLMRQAGYESFWFFRGVPAWDTPSEFLWEGLDGSRIAAFWLPFGYALTYGSPQNLPEFDSYMKQAFDSLEPFTRGTERVGLAGADVCLPEAHIPDLVEAFNQQPDRAFNMKVALPEDFEKAILAQYGASEKPVLRGELNPIFQGAYSSRIELKQITRKLEGLLTTAEKLGALLGWAGQPVEDGSLWQAWEPMLFNQTHDLMSGVMTDPVYEDTLESYGFSMRLAGEAAGSRIQAFVDLVDTQGDGIALFVFNPLGWARTDVAFADIGLSEKGVVDLAITGPDGQLTPVQIIEAERYEDGGLLRARIAFIARDVPALGYAIFRLQALKTAPAIPAAPSREAADALENDLYHLEFDSRTGSITRLVLKEGGWDVLSGPGNVVAMEEDRGDFWEPYHALDGGSRIAMQEKHRPPMPGQAIFSTDQTASSHRLAHGPVYSEFSVAHPFSSTGQFQTTVRLYAGLPRIEIATKILNQDRFVRYRALFPTALSSGQITREIPFGAVSQPDGIEFPAQNWIDLSQEGHGLALLNRGVPGNNACEGTLMLSLMRSTCIVAYGFGGGYEPGMSSDTGFELGKELSFDYALLPHKGSWQDAAVYQEGLAFNQPLIARTAASHAGRLPSRWGALEANQPNIVVSALKPGEQGGVILRLYEAAGKAVSGVKISFASPIKSATQANLLEELDRELEVKDNGLTLDFRAFEIKTIYLDT